MFDALLHLDALVELADARALSKRSDLLWLYRGLWQFYSRTMSSLVRVTSSDLRFWLTDEPYIGSAFEWAEKDRNAAKAWLSRPVGHGERFFLSLETPQGLADYWQHVDSKSEDRSSS